MPHSNDRTLVTCAGDADVRVFDIEYEGRSSLPSSSGSSRRRGLNTVYNGVRYLSEADTNSRVYRSHSDRVKRIVTESSPYLFLTCSEDGEVRQWDLRQPSSAYPPPRGGRGYMARAADDDDASNVPPPLISYKRFRLDLNTISCSASQPHYIALGGAHLHCFLHDRRMLGRDVYKERGIPSSSRGGSNRQEEIMDQATRCVRRFAPAGRKTMKRTDNGHITACKISDANPNEIIVSWSGDYIYSFDIVQSPRPDEDEPSIAASSSKHRSSGRAQSARNRKRKREKTSRGSSVEEGRASSKSRHDGGEAETEGKLALRVRYGNGQSEEIPIEGSRPTDNALPAMAYAREAYSSHPQRIASRLGRGVSDIRKEVFGLETAKKTGSSSQSSVDPADFSLSWISALDHAAHTLQLMFEIIRSWRYPMNPSEERVRIQQTLRRDRESAYRFVQAAGTLSRFLGGRALSGSRKETIATCFQHIMPAPNEHHPMDRSAQFCYDFLKAVLSWLEGSREGLLNAFKPSATVRLNDPRFPVPSDAGMEALDAILIPYLLSLTTDRSILNVDASRFERDEHQILFETEKDAVLAFRELVWTTLPTDAQDRQTTTRFWAFKVARGLLMNAGEGIDFAFVERAFGGLGATQLDESSFRRPRAVAEDSEEDEDGSVLEGDRDTPTHRVQSATVGEGSTEEEALFLDDLRDIFSEQLAPDEDHESNDGAGDDYDDDDDDDDEDEDDEDEGESEEGGEEGSDAEQTQDVWTTAFDRSRISGKVEAHVPCSSHTRVYRGHCNIKTVKDVNFFGLDDEYVVSGSDSGHVFIWDKKTSQLVNILEGDGEVVNVVQGIPMLCNPSSRLRVHNELTSTACPGHPYEPMLAVSGIDHTVKIFSPDRREQYNARIGINAQLSSAAGFSTVNHGDNRARRARLARQRLYRLAPESTEGTRQDQDVEQQTTETDDDSEDVEKIRPRNGGCASRRQMHRSYEITSQNDLERQGGLRDAYVTVGSCF